MSYARTTTVDNAEQFREHFMELVFIPREGIATPVALL